MTQPTYNKYLLCVWEKLCMWMCGFWFYFCFVLLAFMQWSNLCRLYLFEKQLIDWCAWAFVLHLKPTRVEESNRQISDHLGSVFEKLIILLDPTAYQRLYGPKITFSFLFDWISLQQLSKPSILYMEWTGRVRSILFVLFFLTWLYFELGPW